MQYTFDEIERHAYMDGWNTRDCPLFQMAEDGSTLEDIRENVRGYEPEAGFPAEDCLSEIKMELQSILKEMKNNNKYKEGIKNILDLVENKELELSRAAEYGSEELTKMRNQF